jgi:hypothetical protein
MPLEGDRILRGPNLRYPEQPLGFRPPEPEEQQSPPSWWTGPRAGDIVGGGMTNPNVIHQWWRDIAEPSDPYFVRLVAEDSICGEKVRRTPTRLEAKIKTDNLGTTEARRLAAALIEVADLLDAC